MNKIIDVNGHFINQEEADEIVNKIISIFESKKITYAIANMILDETKKELQNIVIKKYV